MREARMMKKSRFTLVELLVSLGVFSILLILFMQFFSSMRLVWTNTEKKTLSHQDVRVAMDIVASVISNMYYTNSNYDYLPDDATGFNSWSRVQFPFRVERNNSDDRIPANMILATKSNLDFPGTVPVRFVGFFVPVPEEKLGVELTGNEKLLSCKEGFNKLFMTVLSNASKDLESDEDISATNRNVYHCFWPSPRFIDPDDDEKVMDVGGALSKLWENLKTKLKIEFDDKNLPKAPVQRIKLLDNVTEFKITMYDKNGHEIGGEVVSTAPYEIEIKLSTLSKEKFEAWCALKGGVDKEEKKDDEGKIPREYRQQNQNTYTRRIYIGDRWAMEEKYEKYN